jgi:hypothetical protein
LISGQASHWSLQLLVQEWLLAAAGAGRPSAPAAAGVAGLLLLLLAPALLLPLRVLLGSASTGPTSGSYACA